LWVRVPRPPLQSRGPAATTPGLHPGNGGSIPSGTTHALIRQLAERLGLNPSVCRFDSCLGHTRLGRQLADHLGLEPGMLWVRFPPELLKLSITSSQSSQECSPPCHGGDRRFKSDRGRFHSAVRKLAKRRSSNLRTPVGSTPTRATDMRRLGIGKPKWL
jgi:hypothetical protein